MRSELTVECSAKAPAIGLTPVRPMSRWSVAGFRQQAHARGPLRKGRYMRHGGQ